jgi:MFS transporter, AAHS family, 4-hydroxybenzoate transporter
MPGDPEGVAVRGVGIENKTVETLSSFLDQGEWTVERKIVLALAALSVIFDGFDNQLMGFAVPAIARDWGVPRSAFAPILALGLAGMVLGSVLAGYFGDRRGRRPALIGCVTVFGLATLGIGFVHHLPMLSILRVIAGAGIGGALPNAGTLTAEFTPLRRRATAVILTIVCLPLGGMVAGVIAAHILPFYSWRVLFFIGGATPLALVAVLLFMLPESPRFLGRNPSRSAELGQLMNRLGYRGPLHEPEPDATEAPAPEQRENKNLPSLFDRATSRDTAFLWIASFCCLACVYLVFSWLPSLLTARGLDLATASNGLAAYNFGGVLGALTCAWLVPRAGSRLPLLSFAGLGAASAVFIAYLRADTSHFHLIASLGTHGFFVNGVQTTIYALAAHIYSVGVRARGIASALAVGRIGSIVSALAGSALIQAGSTVFLGALALGMTCVLIGLALIRNHVARNEAVALVS